MNVTTLINDLGDDIDLLTRHDQWLEEQRIATARKMNELASELNMVMLAQRIKRHLQQQNLVAVQRLSQDRAGDIKNVEVSIMQLPDAIRALGNSRNDYDRLNKTAQLVGWYKDGYDIDAVKH